jgi:hypothetical protein
MSVFKIRKDGSVKILTPVTDKLALLMRDQKSEVRKEDRAKRIEQRG